MHGLDDERAARAQDAPELRERLAVAVLAAVAERREEVQDAVEARVGERKLAVVGLDPARPLAVAGSAACFLEEHRRAVGADDVEAGAGERDRVAPVAAGAIEDVRARLDPGQPRGGERLGRRVDARSIWAYVRR